MGVRLIVEALDYAPDTLTPRERYVLVVLAESARDATRVCWPGIEDDETFIRRSRLKSRSQRYAVIKGLVDKGALESVKRGNRGSRAVYRIARLAPAGAVLPEPQEAPETAASLAAERVPESRTQSGGKGPGIRDKGSRKAGPLPLMSPQSPLNPTRARPSSRSWPPRRDDRSTTNGPTESRSRSWSPPGATWLRPSPTSPRRSGARPTTAP